MAQWSTPCCPRQRHTAARKKKRDIRGVPRYTTDVVFFAQPRPWYRSRRDARRRQTAAGQLDSARTEGEGRGGCGGLSPPRDRPRSSSTTPAPPRRHGRTGPRPAARPGHPRRGRRVGQGMGAAPRPAAPAPPIGGGHTNGATPRASQPPERSAAGGDSTQQGETAQTLTPRMPLMADLFSIGWAGEEDRPPGVGSFGSVLVRTRRPAARRRLRASSSP